MTKLEWQTGDVGMDDDGMDGCYINAFLFIDISSTPPKKRRRYVNSNWVVDFRNIGPFLYFLGEYDDVNAHFTPLKLQLHWHNSIGWLVNSGGNPLGLNRKVFPHQKHTVAFFAKLPGRAACWFRASSFLGPRGYGNIGKSHGETLGWNPMAWREKRGSSGSFGHQESNLCFLHVALLTHLEVSIKGGTPKGLVYNGESH